jgi:hypothetical protein
MGLNIRKATARDAAGWVRLLKEALGADYPAKQVYDLNWAAAQLAGSQEEETWLAEVDGNVRGSISILGSRAPNRNPVANFGRYLVLPENYRDGSAEALIRRIAGVCVERKQMAVLRVAVSDHAAQLLLEQLEYVCVGFQPSKHLFRGREGVLFYVRIGTLDSVVRLPLSQSLPQITELASVVLKNLQIFNPQIVRDGLTGYPLQSTELMIEESTPEAYESCKLEAQPSQPPIEISNQFSRGWGMLRVNSDASPRVLLGQRSLHVVAGLSCYFDEHDKCVRLADAFVTDDLSTGALIQQAVKLAQEQFNAVYVEVDILMTAPRALKSAEQLGFVPVAYLPCFYDREGCCVDVVKMVRLNAVYSLEKATMTPQARAMVDIIDRNFQDQKVGVAIIHLLRGLPIFNGLGDGELCKMARLFEQKLYRANEMVFNKGDSSNEAYIVMRGQIDICLEENAKPVASIVNGAITGEQAFLDSVPRNAIGIAAQPSILLVMQRPAFNALIQSEPHLGMVVMRNIAIEVSSKLRKANAASPAGAK